MVAVVASTLYVVAVRVGDSVGVLLCMSVGVEDLPLFVWYIQLSMKWEGVL